MFKATHSDVTFVNFDIFIFPFWFRILPLVLSQVNINSIIRKVDILGCEVNPSGNSVLNLSILKLYFTFYFGKLWDAFLNRAFPLTKFILNRKISYSLAFVLFPVPFIEFSKDTYSFSSWGPFLILIMISFLVDSIILITFCDFIQSSLPIELSDLGFSHFP